MSKNKKTPPRANPDEPLKAGLDLTVVAETPAAIEIAKSSSCGSCTHWRSLPPEAAQQPMSTLR